MTTILRGTREMRCPSATADASGGLWLSAGDLEAATGWALKPEGLCREEICVPVGRGPTAGLVRGDRIDAAGFWRHLGHPVASSSEPDVWVLGKGAGERAGALLSLEAPDFELPDLTGQTTSLSEQRGQKVLIATWASW